MPEEREVLLEQLRLELMAHTWLNYRSAMAAAEQIGLTMPQFSVLAAIEAQETPCTMQDLIHQTHQSGAALTGVVDRLLTAGLLVRKPHPRDRRMVVVELTDEGRARLAEMKRQGKEHFERITASFSDTELEQLARLVEKLSQGISAVSGHAIPREKGCKGGLFPLL